MKDGESDLSDDARLIADRYQVGALIGRGGMSDVHLGTDTRLGRRVAIKLLKQELANDPTFRLLFREEAQKAARMAHPTVVRVYDAGEETVTDPNGLEVQQPFIVMEYVDGRLLKDIIADGPLEPREAVRIIDGILTALEYSHRALVVHRDIKPGNVMVTQNGQIKVMDFGIARAVSDSSATVADTSRVLGTAQYFSPEQAKGETVDARTDLYSTGVVLFELLTGQPPFRGDRPAAVAYQHISEAPLPPSALNPKVSPALDAVVLHALQKDRLDRFQSAAEFREDLEAAASGSVPAKRISSGGDFTTTLFGVNPVEAAGSEAALRQLETDVPERAVRTQNRPPVAWIWAGVTLIAAILIALAIWVATLPQSNIGESISAEVPDVVGMQYEEGAQALTDAGLSPVRVEVADDSVPRGEILSTEPSAGTRVANGLTVRVSVSQGPASVAVPSLSNLTTEAGIAALEERGLAHGQTSEENSSSLPAGTVIRSEPAAGSTVQKGDLINLVVSNGMVAVPSVVGEQIGAALQTLSSIGLTPNPVADPNCSGNAVTGQSLPAGNHPQGSTVQVTYCGGSAGGDTD